MKRQRPGFILALDIGGTKLAAALFDSHLNLLARSRMPTHAHKGPDAVFERLIQLAETVSARAGIDLHRVRCIGVGCGGPLDTETGLIYSPPNLPGWDAYPLKETLEARFSTPAFVDNDANAAAMAEHRFGAGRNRKNIFYITVSTGIGAGLILDGKIYRGANYSAGEFGHIVLEPNGPRCNCGGRGCLEALASGTAIAKRAREEIKNAPTSLLAKSFANKTHSLTAKDVVAAARQGDTLSAQILREAAHYIGLGITSAIHLLNPEIVIIGGGLTRAGKLLFDPIRTTVAERAQHYIAHFVRIVPAKLGTRVGIYGALAVALDRLPSR
ncbi:MAG: ROK family protein [Candidatus Abyssobacteria bacterium SURF_17]|uniref:ROK family protein n=1 Tax=Candidatus Abyssobacteria bacterium SURF_17 TaxID=2093361 RepID=A0A419F798_9BACT|nr:MAG: ROK family protein [Candidatus Abyssubacteria bacterium SURF_17]